MTERQQSRLLVCKSSIGPGALICAAHCTLAVTNSGRCVPCVKAHLETTQVRSTSTVAALHTALTILEPAFGSC